MCKLWFKHQSSVVTLVYFSDAGSRTKEHVDRLVRYFLRCHWTRAARTLEADVLRALTATAEQRPDFLSRQTEIDKKAVAWLHSKDEDRQDAARRYHTRILLKPCKLLSTREGHEP